VFPTSLIVGDDTGLILAKGSALDTRRSPWLVDSVSLARVARLARYASAQRAQNSRPEIA